MKQTGEDGTDQLRLCIALAVLKSKPQEVSFQSYLLDLQAAFLPSYPVPPTSDYSWKNYALRLERELKELKELSEAQETKLAALTDMNLNLAPEIASGTTTTTTTTTIIDKVHSKTSTAFHASRKDNRSSDLSSGNKKKAKKKIPTAHGNVVIIQGVEVYAPPSQVATAEKQYQSVLKGLLEDVEGAVPRIRELGLTFALRAFVKSLTVSRPGPESDIGGKNTRFTLLPPMIQVLRVTSKVLKEVLDLGHLDTKLANPNILAMLGEVLCHTLPVTLTSMQKLKEDDDLKDWTLLRLTDTDKVFDGLIEGIFVPIIRSFRRLTETKLLELLGEQTKSSARTERSSGNTMDKETHDIDLRPDLLLLFQKLVESLASVISTRTSQLDDQHQPPHYIRRAVSFSSLKACLVLETVRELETVLFFATPEQESRASDASSTESAASGSPPPPPIQNNDRTSRVFPVPVTSTINPRARSLIAKDTLWYLCTVLHLLASLPVADGLQVNYYGTKLAAKNGPQGAGVVKEIGLLDLLHETMLSALYDLVLECQTKIDYGSQPLGADHSSIINEAGLSNAQEQTNPIQEDNSDGGFFFEVSSESQPTHSNVYSKSGSASGTKSTTQRQQEQGRDSTSTDKGKGSEVGDPAGRNNTVTAGGNMPDDANEVIIPVRRLLRAGHQQPELGVISSAANGGRRGRSTLAVCLIDEASFAMLLAVVERYMLDPEYTRLR